MHEICIPVHWNAYFGLAHARIAGWLESKKSMHRVLQKAESGHLLVVRVGWVALRGRSTAIPGPVATGGARAFTVPGSTDRLACLNLLLDQLLHSMLVHIRRHISLQNTAHVTWAFVWMAATALPACLVENFASCMPSAGLINA